MNFDTAAEALATYSTIRRQCFFAMSNEPIKYLGEDEAELANDIVLADILIYATEAGIDCWGIVNGEGEEGDSFSFTVEYSELS